MLFVFIFSLFNGFLFGVMISNSSEIRCKDNTFFLYMQIFLQIFAIFCTILQSFASCVLQKRRFCIIKTGAHPCVPVRQISLNYDKNKCSRLYLHKNRAVAEFFRKNSFSCVIFCKMINYTPATGKRRQSVVLRFR